MVAAVMLAAFIVACIWGRKEAVAVVAIANIFVPDEIPCIDEIIELAVLFGYFRKEYGKRAGCHDSGQAGKGKQKGSIADKSKFF